MTKDELKDLVFHLANKVTSLEERVAELESQISELEDMNGNMAEYLEEQRELE